MELKNLFNGTGTLYKVVARKDGDEFTEGFFEKAFDAVKCANNAYNKLSEYDKLKQEIAVQRFDIKDVIDYLEDETNIDIARENLVFSGYEESVVNN